MKKIKELMNLEGRTALVTGGAGHIGAAICEALAELGANIAVLDSNQDNAGKLSESLIKTYGIKTLILDIDLADEKKLNTVSKIVLEHFNRLDILVNCAALVGTSQLKGWAVPFREQDTDTWRKALEINLTAPFILTKNCAQALEESGHGSIINIGSIYGIAGPDMSLYEGTNMGNPAAYAASKGGLLQFTKWLAAVMAPKVRANAISIGGVFRNQPKEFISRYTNKTPLKRMATEEDIKGAAAYLASDLSAYVTGHNLIVDGGWTTW